jgi:hypothetical protein
MMVAHCGAGIDRDADALACVMLAVTREESKEKVDPLRKSLASLTGLATCLPTSHKVTDEAASDTIPRRRFVGGCNAVAQTLAPTAR